MAPLIPSGKRSATRALVAVLLGVAIAGTLWVPIYARSGPKLGPVPFFYWYQIIWVPVTSVLCWVCYLLLQVRRGRHGAVRR